MSLLLLWSLPWGDISEVSSILYDLTKGSFAKVPAEIFKNTYLIDEIFGICFGAHAIQFNNFNNSSTRHERKRASVFVFVEFICVLLSKFGLRLQDEEKKMWVLKTHISQLVEQRKEVKDGLLSFPQSYLTGLRDEVSLAGGGGEPWLCELQCDHFRLDLRSHRSTSVLS